MNGYDELKNWDPSKGDHVNREQREESRASKERTKKRKIIYKLIGIIALIVILYYLAFR